MAKKHKHPEDQMTETHEDEIFETQRDGESDEEYAQRKQEWDDRKRQERDDRDDAGESTGDEQPVGAAASGDDPHHEQPRQYDPTAPGNEKASESDPQLKGEAEAGAGTDEPLRHRTNIPSDHLTKP